MGKKRDAYKILVGKPEQKRLLGSPRRRCVDNIKMDLREIEWGGMNCINLTEVRGLVAALVNTVMNFRIP
jgi:hypothetical protein